jgi:mono/diheme cytochrome c family protein
MKRFSILFTFLVASAVAILIGCSKQSKSDHSPASPKDTVHTTDTTQHAADSTRQAVDTTQHVDTVKQAIDSLYIAPTLTYEQREGKYIYTKYCNVCHGEQGKGDGFNSYNLDPKPGDLSDVHNMGALSDERVVQAIRDGGAGINKSSLMPSWGGRLNKDEIEYVVAYIRTFAQDTTSK